VKGIKPIVVLLVLVLVLAACTGDPTPTPAPEQQPVVPAEDSSPDNQAGARSTATIPAEVAEAEEPAEPVVPAAPETITITAEDGLVLYGTFYPGAGSGSWPGLLLLHMNGRSRQDWEPIVPALNEAGYAVLALDMRGHGQTGSSKDWDRARGDLQRAWAYLSGRPDVDADRTAIIGASIGANMALVTGALEPAVKTVVLLSPGLNYLGVTTDDAMVNYGSRPVLLVASEEDQPAADSSRELHELAQGEARIEMYENAGHGTRMFTSRPELTDLLIGWLDSQLAGAAAVPGDAGPVSAVPAPTLFATAWDDRRMFRAGLVDEEAATLDGLPGASIYHMDLAISPDLLRVAGRLEVRYTNQEDVSLDTVYFHLFPNLLGGTIEVDSVTVNHQPSPYRLEVNDSILAVPLVGPLAPGQQAVIHMAFLVNVPSEGGSNYGVFAAIDGVLALAHFYPQIAVFDDEGWNTSLPSENADVTYADASFYLVKISAPAGQVVIASGIALEQLTEGDEQVLTVAAGPARDFYLVSSDRYTVYSRTVGQTTINSYGFPEFAERTEAALDYAAGAMVSFNNRLGTYPYTEFDIAPTPNLALGVEYPGVVVINARLYDPQEMFGDTPSGFYIESTVAHEVGHQYFYNTVGNDQPDEPWVDESLVQYMTYLYYLDTYGPGPAGQFRDSFFFRWDRVERAEIPIGLPAGAYVGTEYSAIVYGRGPLFFEALEAEMGADTFVAFLRDYYQQHKWGIASGDSLKALAEAHCNCDLNSLFAEWVDAP
jgi:pimeloyl-ACP methyl ester carboxylesterase